MLKRYNVKPEIRGHVGSLSMSLLWRRLIEAIREDRQPDADVYNSVISSVISPLSEISAAKRSKSVDFPDFTRGKWKNRPALEFS